MDVERLPAVRSGPFGAQSRPIESQTQQPSAGRLARVRPGDTAFAVRRNVRSRPRPL